MPQGIGKVLTIAVACVCLCSPGQAAPTGKRLPNIVYILCDDLGYGDVHCLNPKRGKIPTPHMDRLASQGMIFTDAHSGSSVCTPSRYAILTGRYSWRSRLQVYIVNAYDPALIAADRLTVPALLRRHGYQTAGVGKWHLGWGVPMAGDQVLVDRPLTEGPTTRGFDYYFCYDLRFFPPYLFTENDRFAGAPLRHVTSRTGVKPSVPPLADAEFTHVLPTLTEKAVDYVAAHATDEKPFFLFWALNSPHTPLAPTKQWQGKSGLGLYGDYVMETDDEVGKLLAALDRHKIADNTLVVFASDNGCAPYIGVKDLEAKGHYPSAQLRGYKADLWDGGHRIPLIIRWPGQVQPGASCGQTVGLCDLLATCAQMLGDRLPDNAGEDSVSILPLLKGEDRPVREAIIHHSITGKFSIRQGKWKLEFCPGSGGWDLPDETARKRGLPELQLYDMTADIGEQKNLRAEYAEVVQRLTSLLEKYVAEGRSTPGAAQKNDVPVDIFKRPAPVRR